MGILDVLAGADHPKNVAKAWDEMTEMLRRQNMDTDAYQVDVQQGTVGDPSQYQRDVTPLDRWKQQINAMVSSGNPILQQQGLDMIANYQSRATAPKGNQPAMSTAGKMAVEMGLTPGTPEFAAFIKSYAFKEGPKQYAPKYVTPAEAQKIEWVDKSRTEPLVGQNWEDIRGSVRKTDDASEMRDSAMNAIGALETALFNPETGIYNDPVWQGEGATGVIKGGLAGALQDLTQSNPDYKAYSDVRAGTATQVIRAMGEKGALSDKDIERALALLPNISGFRGMPDLPATAQKKFEFLKVLLQIDPHEWTPLLDMAEAQGLLEERTDEAVPDEDLPPGAVGAVE